MIRAAVCMPGSDRRDTLIIALEHERDIDVVAQVDDPAAVVPAVARLQPDLVLLDLEPDHSAAVAATGDLMARTPTPILLLSRTGDDRGSPAVMAALVAGALEALPMPEAWTAESAATLRHLARQLSRVPVIRHPRGSRCSDPAPVSPSQFGWPVVALAASTGGPAALAQILGELDGLEAAVLVVQHLHPDFTGGLLEWMSRASSLPVELARHGGAARPGRVYLAGAGAHLRLGPRRQLELAREPETTHRPSADELMASVARHAGSAGVGVLLTGMGEDGARGLLAMRRSGAHTYAQDEQSSAVFGMPAAAHRLGAAEALVPLTNVAATVRRAVAATRGGTR